MNKFIISIAFVLALAPTGSEGFQNYNKEYNPYLPNQQQPPMIYGSVVSVSDHSVTLASDEGENMTFDIDSRSVLPARLDEGQRVKVEFHLMDSGRYIAKRVTPLLPGEMPTAMAPPYDRRDRDEAMTSSETYRTESDRAVEHRSADNVLVSTKVGEGDAAEGDDKNERSTATTSMNGSNDDDRNLPGTASQRPLIELLGVLALVTGAGLWLVRRRHRSA